MSANEGATIAWKPKSWSAQGACSREEPQPKLRPGDQDRVRLELDLAVADPVVEEELAEAGPLDPLQELLGDDLVGVDVGAVQDRDLPSITSTGSHLQLQSLMSTKWPSIAAAAAIFGLTRWVRPPLPWRPSKLRFEVEAQRSPSIEDVRVHPQAHRAARRRATRSRPSGRPRRGPPLRPRLRPARSRGRPSPRTDAATLRPSTTPAASRRSSIREFVQEPMKTRSSAISVIGVPGSSAM